MFASSPLLSLAVTFFLIANPIGNIPAFVAQVKDFEFNRQRIILLRESGLALFIALFFQFLGEKFLGLIMVKDFSLTLCGGLLIFLNSLNMIFPKSKLQTKVTPLREPLIFPIATPMISGPGLLAMIMLSTHQEFISDLTVTGAILLAWIGVSLVLIIAPYLQKIIDRRGLQAIEQLMGMILCLIAVNMIVKGFLQFLSTISLY